MTQTAMQRRRPRRTRRGRSRIAAALLTVTLGAAMLAPTTPATAQERYELSPEGWQKQQAPDPETPEGRLMEIRRLLAEGNPGEAEERAERWILRYPNHPRLVEARLLRGDARVAQREYYNALFDYEYVIRLFPASPEFHTALQREYEIARLFVNGMKRRFLGMRILPAQGEGEELLIRIQERAPGSELGERASLTLADYYYQAGEMTTAAEAYDLFLENYPQSTQREWAMLRLIQANLARFQGPPFDSTGLLEAMQRLRAYQDEFPAAADRIGADALLVRINESLAMKELFDARWYAQRGEMVSAAYLYQRLVEAYPETSAAETALARLQAMPEPILEGLARLERQGGPVVPAEAAGTVDIPAPAGADDEPEAGDAAPDSEDGQDDAEVGDLIDYPETWIQR